VRKLKFTGQARRDLRGIKSYIAKDKPSAAENFVDELEKTCRLLAESPEIGLQKKEYYGFYGFPHKSYMIFYDVVGDAVVIAHITRGGRLLEALLRRSI
jgi:toxin ParE1/3/4